MLSIHIPSTYEIPKGCNGRSTPTKDDGYYSFQVTDEEYMFWNGLALAEREELTRAMREECFLDVLHAAMKKMRPNNYSVENEQFVQLK
ncbi:MAG: hypothetical protein ACYC7D_03560 [Nitrososphaerales archaeon]